ncbi:uncharacterized protein BDZ99DRAFT_273300 [Mytilinidion resinicola]|uniref:Uncharacterized protein n=1 Tax=Mytilinidion resinicola TaxID=574789 RepID=A0A6A6YXN1_9PEZI|nr:uncharacterized protein BDZ99DRAFT_273300 [Mytilinidion resinicola]KAF2812754.1 hypothetical protein BDZ99DRAFT_273300 [Mytilinidion resinicola]
MTARSLAVLPASATVSASSTPSCGTSTFALAPLIIVLIAITHYPESIQRLGAIRQSDTGYGEQAHKKQKEFYRRTNKRDDHELQMLRYNTMYFDSIVQNELRLWMATKATSDSDHAIQTVRLSAAIDVYTHRSYMWDFDHASSQYLKDRKINISTWRTVEEVQARTGATDLAAKLAPFVRECRKRMDGVQRTDKDVDRIDAETDWVLNMPMSIHHSVACYIRLGKDATDINKLDKVFARCTPSRVRKIKRHTQRE